MAGSGQLATAALPSSSKDGLLMRLFTAWRNIRAWANTRRRQPGHWSSGSRRFRSFADPRNIRWVILTPMFVIPSP